MPVAADGRLELRLMSFNVRYENPDDTGSRAWRRRVPGVVRMIREEAPDVIGVQEALHGQAADLWASLPDYEFFGAGRDDGRRSGEYAGIFFRRDRFEVNASDCGTFWLSDTPESPGSKTWGNGIPRTATWLRLVDRASQRGFYVYNTHWDHRHQGSRERSARLLAERIGGRKSAKEPVVMLGDFNALETNPGLADLVAKCHLADTFRKCHPGESARSTLHFWRATRTGELKVDHILVSDGAEVLSAEIRDRDAPVVSDHFPITARVAFP
ncbi:MAG: endonuclease/exonuclease/phosphatase family protein [Luteolibacter sp.]|nr:endonuclease/exonuclease/phosphatase family protein [Luteolibacter sp.]